MLEPAAGHHIIHMTSTPPNPELDSQAIAVAWKFRCLGYDSEEAAIRALRRRCRGLSQDDAAAALRTGKQLIERAILVLKPQIATLAGIFKSSGEIALADVEPMAPELTRHFPNCSADAIRSALLSAVIYHMR